MNSYDAIEALLGPVKSGAIAPVSGHFLLKLAAGCRVLEREVWFDSGLPGFLFSIPLVWHVRPGTPVT